MALVIEETNFKLYGLATQVLTQTNHLDNYNNMRTIEEVNSSKFGRTVSSQDFDPTMVASVQ